MELKELKEKIISEINDADKKDVLEEILFLLKYCIPGTFFSLESTLF